jgi:hypothetical protein
MGRAFAGIAQKNPEKNPPPNWISDEEAVRIIDKIRKEHPDSEISYDSEHFLVTNKSGKLLRISRWLEIPRSSDGGETIDSYVPVQEVIEKSLLD